MQNNPRQRLKVKSIKSVQSNMSYLIAGTYKTKSVQAQQPDEVPIDLVLK